MKAITTKYHGCTETRGSRISATDGDNKVSIPYPHELNSEEGHILAAKTLCDKLGWDYQFITGGTKDGYVHVLIPSEILSTLKEAYVQVTNARVCLNANEGDPEHFAHKAQGSIKTVLGPFR